MAKKERAARQPIVFPPRLIGVVADEIAKTVIRRLPHILSRPRRKKKTKKIEKAVFLDTSAIIDGRVFDVIHLGLIQDPIVVPEHILLELKRIADSQDAVKRERGRKGLEKLEQLRRRRVKFTVLPEEQEQNTSETDEKLIKAAKAHRGRIITCDYNLEKKANIEKVRAINVNALAQALKVIAVPGEALHVRVLHQGKDASQGVGYLDDGTMIVVEYGRDDVGKTVTVVVSRVIQTVAGRILFAKKV